MGCWVSKLLSFSYAVSLFDQQREEWPLRGRQYHDRRCVANMLMVFNKKHAQKVTVRKTKSDEDLLRIISCPQICSLVSTIVMLVSPARTMTDGLVNNIQKQ